MSEESNIPKGQPLALDEVRSLLESGMAVQLTLLCNAKTFNVGYIYFKNSRGERYYERYYFNPYGDVSTAKKEEVWQTCEDLMEFLNEYVQNNTLKLVKIDNAETEKYSWDCRLESGILCKSGDFINVGYVVFSWVDVIRSVGIALIGGLIFYILPIGSLPLWFEKISYVLRLIPDFPGVTKWVSLLLKYVFIIVLGLIAIAIIGSMLLLAIYVMMLGVFTFFGNLYAVISKKLKGESIHTYASETIIRRLYQPDDSAVCIVQHGLDQFAVGYYLQYDLMDKYKYAIPEEVIASGKGTGLFDKEHKEEYYFIDNHYYLFWEDFERDLRKYEQNGEFSVIEINKSKKKQ